MIPATVTAAHVLDAIRTIDRDGVPRGRTSRGYDLVHEGRAYPPKYVVALATKAATGRLLTSEEFSGGDETNDLLRKLGFAVVAKGDPVAALEVAATEVAASGVEVVTRTNPDDSATGPVRVAVFSFRCGTPESERDAVADAFAAARAEWDGGLLVLLPGGGQYWQEDTNHLTSLAKQHRANVMFENGAAGDVRFASFDLSTGLRRSECGQVFSTSREANKDPNRIRRVLDQCEAGRGRRFDVAGLDVGLLICGENNTLVNLQSNGNRCGGVRGHPGMPLFEDVDIVHNGAHTLMGNWSKLNARFGWLSRDRRLMTYCTNNNSVKGPWRRAVRLYYDGDGVANGEEVRTVGSIKVDLLRDPQDRYRGLATALPPSKKDRVDPQPSGSTPRGSKYA